VPKPAITATAPSEKFTIYSQNRVVNSATHHPRTWTRQWELKWGWKMFDLMCPLSLQRAQLPFVVIAPCENSSFLCQTRSMAVLLSFWNRNLLCCLINLQRNRFYSPSQIFHSKLAKCIVTPHKHLASMINSSGKCHSAINHEYIFETSNSWALNLFFL
jgi:hypothetical protein